LGELSVDETLKMGRSFQEGWKEALLLLALAEVRLQTVLMAI